MTELTYSEMVSIDGGEPISLTAAALIIGGGIVVGLAIAYFT